MDVLGVIVLGGSSPRGWLFGGSWQGVGVRDSRLGIMSDISFGGVPSLVVLAPWFE